MKSSSYKAIATDQYGYVKYSDQDIDTWRILCERQAPLAKAHACSVYLTGLSQLNLNTKRPAQIPDIDAVLQETTGWALEPVPALINFNRFFGLLAKRKFPAATFMRRPEELEYLEEPDLFHEIVGHCPMLTNGKFSEFSQWVGEIGSMASAKQQAALARVYWFTVEFGLIKEGNSTKIFGGGILSSPLEIKHCLDTTQVEHRPFNLKDVLRTPYKINQPQPIYYVLEAFEQLIQLQDFDIFAELDSAIHDLDKNMV